MTFLEFNTLVDNIGKHSKPYITLAGNATEFKAMTNECLRRFSSLTRCLYDEYVTITLAADTSTYSVRTTTPAMAQVDNVFFLNKPLKNTLGDPGPWTLEELRESFPDYAERPSDRPQLWFPLTMTQIRIWPAPDAVYSGTFVSGWALHTSLSGDSDNLELPEEFQFTAAVYAASRLISVNAAGSSLERMEALDPKAASDMEVLMAQGKEIMGRLRVKGHTVRAGQ